MIEAPTVRKNTLRKQQKEIAVLHKLYNNLPVGVEKDNINAKAWEDANGLGTSVVIRAIQRFEDAGILKRRTTSVFGVGKTGHWTLLVPKEEAMQRLNQSHRQEFDALNSTKGSLKSRIYQALMEKESFGSMLELVKYISDGTENIDLHNATKCLHALEAEGKVDFRKTSKGNGSGRRKAVPTDIHLAKTKYTPKTDIPEATNIAEDIGVEEDIHEIIPQETQPMLNIPMIEKLVSRRETLQNLSRQADEAGETEVAIMLMEKADQPLSEYEQEVVALYNAYMACKG